VGLLKDSQGGFCTATLVGKKTLVTASHCIEAGQSYTFQAGGATYSVTRAVRHPQYKESAVNNAAYNANDIAVVILAQAPAVAPSLLATTAPTVGLPVTLVGFGTSGETAQDDAKRIGKTAIGWVSSTEVGWKGSSTTSTTCYGDSGGPSFATMNGQEVQVSVCSRGTGICGVDDIQTRVDPYLSWIEQEAQGDVSKGGVTSPSVDQQAPRVAITAPADGALVEGAVAVKAVISDDVGVVKAQLVVDGTPAAPLLAPPWEFQAALAPGKHSLVVEAWDAAGNHGEAGVTVSERGAQSGSFGDACSVGGDCASGLCAGVPGGSGRYCTELCAPQVASCPSGAGCLSAGGSVHVCGLAAEGTPGGASPYVGIEMVGTCAVGPLGAASSRPGLPLVALLALVVLAGRRGRRMPD
jgi:hypothetical protein